MNELLSKITNELNKRSMREQWFITLFLMVVIFLIWFFVLIMPLSRSIDSIENKMHGMKKSLLTLTKLYNHYQSIYYSPTDAFKKKVESLESQLKRLEYDPVLNKKIVGSPQDLQDVLQAISKTSAMISLNQVQKLSLTPIAGPKKTALMKQRIMIEFTGNYFDTVQYLTYLENLPWYVSFDSLEYRVDAYPNANVKLMIDVLSAG